MMNERYNMRPIDVKEQARGAIFGALGTAALAAIVLIALAFVAFGCSSSPRESVAGAEAKKPAAAVVDVAGEEAIRAKLAEASANGAAPEEIGLLRTQLEEARKMNRVEAERDLDAKNRLKAKGQKQAAAEDFYASVKSWTGWATGLLVVASIGLLVASFFMPTLPRRGAFIGLIASAGISMLRLALLRYGVLATDLMVYALFGCVVLGVVFVAVPLAIGWVRSRIQRVGVGMIEEAKGAAVLQGPTPEAENERRAAAEAKAREATALLAVANRHVNAQRKAVAKTLALVIRGETGFGDGDALKGVGVKV